jgi:cytochrome c-type biogenesis protein CcmH
MPALRQRATELATRLKLDPAKEVPGVAPTGPSAAQKAGDGRVSRGPTAGDVEAASQLTPEEKEAMIKGMIASLEARLKNNPNDLEGWLMLARSRKVTGDSAGARKALDRAQTLFGNDPQMRARITQAAAELELGGQ